MRRMLAPVAALTILVGCNSAITDPNLLAQCGDEPTQDHAEEVINQAVPKLPFKDPLSVQVRDIAVIGPRKWVNVNGTLYGWQIRFSANAKNSYGGYTGFRNFVCLLQANNQYWIRPAAAFD